MLSTRLKRCLTTMQNYHAQFCPKYTPFLSRQAPHANLNVPQPLAPSFHHAHHHTTASSAHHIPSRHYRTSKRRKVDNTLTRAATQQQEAQTELPESIYDNPILYEQAFSFRNTDQEVTFIQECARKFRPNAQLLATLELGCGPANHSIQLAIQGIQAVALDCNEAMLQHAQSQAKPHNLGSAIHFLQADMQEFELPKDGPVSADIAFCFLGTWCHLLDNTAALNALKCIHRSLSPGGLLIIEVEHPEHLFSGCLMDAYGTEGRLDEWEINLDSESLPRDLQGARMQVDWGGETDMFDPVSQVIMRHVSIEVQGARGLWKGPVDPDTGTLTLVVEETVPQRMWTYQELKLLAQVTDFEVVCEFGALDIDVELDSEDAYRMVLVLQKRL